MEKSPGTPARLEDVLNYDLEQYLKDDETALIRNTFKDPRVMKVLRKVLLPTFADPDMPIEEIRNDIWLSGRDYGAIPNEEIKSIVLARQDAVKFIMGGLVRLKVIANSKVPTEAEEIERRRKDSVK